MVRRVTLPTTRGTQWMAGKWGQRKGRHSSDVAAASISALFKCIPLAAIDDRQLMIFIPGFSAFSEVIILIYPVNRR